MTAAPDHDERRIARTTAADYAVRLIEDGQTVGLGSGRAATAFVDALAAAVRRGLRVRGIATSEATAREARRGGIPLASLEEIAAIDIAVDGADEVDPDLNLIKGYGGALVRERVVETSAKRTVILVGAEKLVPILGTRGNLPVEVVPFALPFCLRRLSERGLRPVPRASEGGLFLTDNRNYLVDCAVDAIHDPWRLERDLRALPGVVDTGLFLEMADLVLIEDGEDLLVRVRSRALTEPPGRDSAETRR
jgi:ribose 5-phosphate isomerase A